MSKKKTNSILKGVAGVGAVLGGAGVLGESDIVYAQEQNGLEEKEIRELLALEDELENASTSASASVTISESAVTAASKSASESSKDSESQANSISESNSAVVSETEIVLASESDSIASLSGSVSTSLANSTELAESESLSASEALEEAFSIYNSASTEFEENDYNDPYLEQLLKDIAAAQTDVAAEKQKALESGKQLNSVGIDYYPKADHLANLLVQYKYYQEGYVDKIEYSKWESHSRDNNYVKVTSSKSGFTNANAYFDYVNADSNDNLMPNTDNPVGVDHIYVLKKTPIFQEGNKGVLGIIFYYTATMVGRRETERGVNSHMKQMMKAKLPIL